MEDLISLVRLIATQKIEQIDLFNSKVDLPHLTRKLYEGIVKGEIKDEEEGILAIYNDRTKKKNFNKLETRLKNRILNTLFFLQNTSQDRSEMRKARYSVARDFSLINILRDRNEKRTSIKIAVRAYNKAVKYELTEYAIMIARKLHEYYGYSYPSKKKMIKYQSEISKLQHTLNAEIKAEEYYTKFSYLYVTKKSKFSRDQLNEIKSYVDHLIHLKSFTSSFKFNLDSYNVITSYFIFIDEYDKAIKYCEEALEFFESKPYEDKSTKWAFRNSLILAYIGKRKYSEAAKYTALNFKIIKRGTYNWYMQCNYEFILLSAQQDYQKLYDLVLDVTSTKNYKKLIIQHEYWNVNEAYIQFLIRMEKVDPNKNNNGKRLRPFSLARFLNDVPKFSKDKRGLNISILIIQYLFLLLDRKYSKLIDRLDAIKQYSYRYLKNDESYRSNLFIKMLLKVADADFHPIAAERYTKEMHTKLLASNPSANFQSTEIEVIPYEKLWEIVMELLEKNRNKKNS